jgi:hypothetical protein
LVHLSKFILLAILLHNIIFDGWFLKEYAVLSLFGLIRQRWTVTTSFVDPQIHGVNYSNLSLVNYRFLGIHRPQMNSLPNPSAYARHIVEGYPSGIEHIGYWRIFS